MSFFIRFFTSPVRMLTQLDALTLKDIGIDRYDLFEARQKGRNAAAFLSERRCEHAEAALR